MRTFVSTPPSRDKQRFINYAPKPSAEARGIGIIYFNLSFDLIKSSIL